MGLHDEAKLDRKFMEFVKLMNVHLNHFPSHEKFGLALEIRRAVSILLVIARGLAAALCAAAVSTFFARRPDAAGWIAWSVPGHARRTRSLQHMLRNLLETRCELYHQLPKVYR
jgi:hypothetical protein